LALGLVYVFEVGFIGHELDARGEGDYIVVAKGPRLA